MTGGRSKGGAPKPGAAWSGGRSRRLVALTLSEYGDVCHLCGISGATTADHIVPRSHGGSDALDNLRPAHASCNYSRGNKTIEEWFALRPFEHKPKVEPSRKW